MTFEESAQLMNDATFRSRVKVACISYAGGILAAPQPGATALFRWAQNTFTNPDFAMTQVTPPAVMNINVQQAGADIDDNALLATVGYVVGTLL